MAKLIKTVIIQKTITYEADLSKQEIEQYLENEDSCVLFNFEETDCKERQTEWVRIYTDQKPY
jgi:hypothetical protein